MRLASGASRPPRAAPAGRPPPVARWPAGRCGDGACTVALSPHRAAGFAVSVFSSAVRSASIEGGGVAPGRRVVAAARGGRGLWPPPALPLVGPPPAARPRVGPRFLRRLPRFAGRWRPGKPRPPGGSRPRSPGSYGKPAPPARCEKATVPPGRFAYRSPRSASSRRPPPLILNLPPKLFYSPGAAFRPARYC